MKFGEGDIIKIRGIQTPGVIAKINGFLIHCVIKSDKPETYMCLGDTPIESNPNQHNEIYFLVDEEDLSAPTNLEQFVWSDIYRDYNGIS